MADLGRAPRRRVECEEGLLAAAVKSVAALGGLIVLEGRTRVDMGGSDG